MVRWSTVRNQGEAFRRSLGRSGLVEGVEFVGDARPHGGRVGVEAVLGGVGQERADLRQRVRVRGRRDVEPQGVGNEDGHPHQVQEVKGAGRRQIVVTRGDGADILGQAPAPRQPAASLAVIDPQGLRSRSCKLFPSAGLAIKAAYSRGCSTNRPRRPISCSNAAV